MYEQLDRMKLKSQADDLNRELRNARLAEEALKGKKNKRGRGLLTVLANTLRLS